MNRITNRPAVITSNRHNLESKVSEAATVCSVGPGSNHPYHLLGPAHYEQNYAYPLLVWLHSAGDDEKQLRRLMPHISLRNYVAVGPRGVVPDTNGRSFNWSSDWASTETAWNVVQTAIAAARTKYNVNAQRVFLAGLHDGGTMALRLAMAQPELFAGAISLGGAFPLNCGALNRLHAVRQIPLLISRGMDSSHYSESQMCEEIRLFHAAHMKVHYRQYFCGDEPIVPMFRDINSWLMEQVTGMPVLAESDASAASS